MHSFVRFCDRLSHLTGVISGIIMILSTVLVLAEIIVRTAFDKTLYITEEYSGYLMAIMTFMSLAYTLRDKSHIRMMFMHTLAKGKGKVYVDILAFSIGFLFCLLLTYTTADFFWDSIATQSRSMQISQTYLAIPQFFMPLGLLILTLQFAGEVVRSALILKSGNFEQIEAESSTLGR